MSIPDDELLIYIQNNPGARVMRICERFGLKWQRSPAEGEPGYGYTVETAQLRRQLQRLRRTGKIRSQGGLWWTTEEHRDGPA